MSPFEPLQLPNGQVLVNRIAKAAMEENMADAQQAPSRELKQLYQAWADGEPGLLLTGNVMIDRRAMTGPGGVALEDERSLDSFREWAALGRNNGGHFWVQLNHPGRQTPANLRQQALAPSAVALDLGIFSKMFAKPRAMSEDEIQNVITRFATSARLAEKAGFTGVQIHAAHGYLLSQFLSPLSNRRTDHWGGSLPNRARLLMEVIKAVRASVSPSFCVGVKLNSADFQRGGFDADDARAVIELLNALPIDLLELSGGSYEAPAMQGEARDGRSPRRADPGPRSVFPGNGPRAGDPRKHAGDGHRWHSPPAGSAASPRQRHRHGRYRHRPDPGTATDQTLARRSRPQPANHIDQLEAQAPRRPRRGASPDALPEPRPSPQSQGCAVHGTGPRSMVYRPAHSPIPRNHDAIFTLSTEHSP
ncbi:2,4-dienoyl-CoA reductase-like NADH-dependent reductase (Old Yellow Enzyme family) [Pseudomonas sp. TE36184]